MKLLVRVIEAKNIPAMDPNGFSDPYVRLRVGNQRHKTKVVKKSLNPSWCEEFTFKVDDLKEQLVISVLDQDTYKIDDFVGYIKVPVSRVFDADDKSLGTAWYTLLPKNKKKAKNKDCGEILLTICFSQNSSFAGLQPQPLVDNGSLSRKSTDGKAESPLRSFSGSLRSSSPLKPEDVTSSKEDKPCKFKDRLAQIFNKNGDKNGDTLSATSSKGYDLSEITETTKSMDYEDRPEEPSSSADFEELLKSMEMKDQGSEMPSNLPGGVVVDQLYAIAPSELNTLLFSPDSNFPKLIADFQGSTDLQLGPWKLENNGESLKRVVTCIKAATRIIKAIKAIEDQTYLKADGNAFAVLGSVNTPDAPYGSNYRAEVLFCITPGPELPSGDQSSHLVISWRMKFLQSTMMKGMIEGGARQGIKDSFQQFATLLAQNVKPVDTKDIGSEKEQVLASLEVEPQSDWKLAVQYFANFTVISTILMGLYVLVHVWLTMPSTIQGLEFGGLDLPDSIGEIIVCGVLVLQAERVMNLVSRFMQARVQKGSDHGIKAQGDGWLLTVALVEGSNLASVDSSGFSDPYVVFTCNGKTRTSSIKFQKSDPRWNACRNIRV